MKKVTVKPEPLPPLKGVDLYPESVLDEEPPPPPTSRTEIIPLVPLGVVYAPDDSMIVEQEEHVVICVKQRAVPFVLHSEEDDAEQCTGQEERADTSVARMHRIVLPHQ